MKPNIASKVDLSGLKNAVLNFLVPLICLGVTGALALLVIYPSIISIGPLKQEIAQKTDLKNALDTKVNKLKDLQSFRSVVKENSELINRVFVSESSAPLFLDEINQLSRGAGFEVTRLATSSAEADPTTNQAAPANPKNAPAPTNEIKTITAALGAKGSYDDLIKFMADLEAASRVLYIKDFRYNFRAETDGSVTASALDLSISGPYMQVESTAVTDEPIDLDVKSPAFQNIISLLKKLKQYDFSGEFQPIIPKEAPATPETPAPAPTPTPVVQGAKTKKSN